MSHDQVRSLAIGSVGPGTTPLQPKPPLFAAATLEAYVKASNTDEEDTFGLSVALDGDTLVVGAPGEASNATGIDGIQANNGAPNSGAVYVFTRTNGVWSQQAYLKALNTGVEDFFGGAVALDGDTLVVGAAGEDSSATGVNGNQADNSAIGSGAAYVFTRTNGVWSQQAYLKASNTETGDRFGSSVALDGDTLVVGARREASNATGIDGSQANNGAPNSGAVYVFTRTNSVWSQQAYLKASNTGESDLFGIAVALDGDTLVVGAEGESSLATGIDGIQANNGASDSGAAYIFIRTNSAWSQQAYLKASNTETGDRFGESVAVDGNTLVVGASYESSLATGVNGNQASIGALVCGAAYIFIRTNSAWSQQTYLKASNTAPDDHFGRSVALDGNALVVGAPLESSNATGINGNQSNDNVESSGAVYVFTTTGWWSPLVHTPAHTKMSKWRQDAYIKASNTGTGDSFGYVTALSGNTLVVGAPIESSNATGINHDQLNDNAPNSGAVYVYRAKK